MSIPLEPFWVLRFCEEGAGVVVRRERIPWEALDPGSIGIRIHYSGINYKDLLAATGRGQILRRNRLVGGIDLAGEVIDSRDPAFPIGSHVAAVGGGLGETRDGGYAEYARLDPEQLVRLDPQLSPLEAMQIGTAGFTAALAYQAIREAGIGPGAGPVVVSGANGGVGCFAVDLLAGQGYPVTALTRQSAWRRDLLALGAREVLDSGKIDPSPRPLLRGQWAAGIDNLGDPVLSWMIRSAKPQAAIAVIGMAASARLETSVFPFILRGVRLLGINSTQVEPTLRKTLWRHLAGDWRPRALAQMAPRQLAFDELPAFFAAPVQPSRFGRTVVRIHPELCPTTV
jgi:putative YhdH/YhfP family quinone oxidoreductase